ncbi:4Fe-4S dicluster domain-containing protein [Desulforhopalus singaporensis]|uniref:2-oxoglutarate ferredoxin oxidoreductase subunit delta n=1 Tax=Desulforhopalus singaporensis TaxID=91360 RepID=A0A1H0L9Y5_9BACT|nr:4Fe-4S binding protein [Desulforhopalus singaporensis]SDO64813.1 2-oxoglutarate ferredoxin oxidoreductase subunit delta [Desulforhopalus singaporensis]
MTEPKGSTQIETDRCKGCGLCVAVCPLELLTQDETTVNIKGYFPAKIKYPKKCKGCGFCALMCPDSVITVWRAEKQRRVCHA